MDTSHSHITQIKAALTNPIALVGMMGAGKSHMGRALSLALDVKLFDSDTLIEEKAGQPVADIFKNFGEEKFRKSESTTIIDLLGQEPCVIATGGGALTTPATLSALKEQSTMIWLNADIDVMWQRVQKSQNRPLLHADNPKETLAKLLASREHLYNQAHIHVPIEHNNEKHSEHTLIKALYTHLFGDTV